MVDVALPGIGVSLVTSVAVSLFTTMPVMAGSCVSLLGVAVSIMTTPQISSGILFQFNSTTQSMYLPLLGGFA